MSGRPGGIRQARVEEISRLHAQGLTKREIGERLGLSRQTVSDYLNDPDGAKRAARQERYRRPCPSCGRLMSGSEGRGARAPKHCANCSHPPPYWTRERILDAIRRFVAENGRPPTSTEWLHADPERGYPPMSAVYGRKGKNPFARWADAIEAAGYERPHVGYKLSDRKNPGVILGEERAESSGGTGTLGRGRG